MSQKALPLFAAATLVAGLASTANAATIGYNFDQGGLTGWTTGPTTLTAAASNNDFGSGVTVSDYSFTGGTANGTPTESSRDRQIGFVGGQARAMLNNEDSEAPYTQETHSFVITIPVGVTVDLTSLAWDSGTVFAENSWELDIVAGSGATFSTTGAPFTDTAPDTLRTANNSEALSGLTGLTNTTVTVTITDTSARNNNSNEFYSFVDNVVLTGAAVPEPGSLALIGLGGLLVARRRRD